LFASEQRDTNGLAAENSDLKIRLQTMEQQVHLQDGKWSLLLECKLWGLAESGKNASRSRSFYCLTCVYIMEMLGHAAALWSEMSWHLPF